MTWQRDALGRYRRGDLSIQRFQSGMRGSAVQWILRREAGPRRERLGDWPTLRDAKAAADRHERLFRPGSTVCPACGAMLAEEEHSRRCSLRDAP